ncbi:hypothetical protein PSTT_03873 [Puccinia striiformis]|uniref:Uncharacterized protein n=1 Tax=Puccinia striiformis TaxID=27350 RepID=A0A2S4VV16_9BASI|nr:hypothetical protein PSTT_03873 [Puccinia striiformis]
MPIQASALLTCLAYAIYPICYMAYQSQTTAGSIPHTTVTSGSGLVDVTPGNSESPRTTSTDWAQSVPTQQDERRFGPDSKLEGLKPAR